MWWGGQDGGGSRACNNVTSERRTVYSRPERNTRDRPTFREYAVARRDDAREWCSRRARGRVPLAAKATATCSQGEDQAAAAEEETVGKRRVDGTLWPRAARRRSFEKTAECGPSWHSRTGGGGARTLVASIGTHTAAGGRVAVVGRVRRRQRTARRVSSRTVGQNSAAESSSNRTARRLPRDVRHGRGADRRTSSPVRRRQQSRTVTTEPNGREPLPVARRHH